MKLKKPFEKKLIYVTPGAGKTFLSDKNIKFYDADELMLEEIQRLYPEFIRKSKESIQEYIFRFSIEYNRKRLINELVLKKARLLNDDGFTVLTGTLKLAKYADHVFVIDPYNPRLKNRFGTLERALEWHNIEVQKIREFKVPYQIIKRNIEDELLMKSRKK